MAHPKTKIAIVSHSLGLGGAERFAGLLGQMLDGLGYDIHNILIEDKVAYDYAGKMYNLGQICANDNVVLRKIIKCKLLKKYLADNQIPIVIDNRSRPIFARELFTRWIYGKRDKIYVVHSYNLSSYLPKMKFLAQWLYADAKSIVCVSKAIESEINSRYNLHNTTTIYNPIPEMPITDDHSNPIAGDYFLYFGRLDDKVKNFKLMLEAFARSQAKDKIKLVIMGDGPDADLIRNEIKSKNLESVVLLPFQANPYAIVQQAKFTILTSRYEGFPMSVIESLALGVPVVAVDCQSGPSEVIQNEHNGLLVANHDSGALAQAILRFANENDLLDICRHNAAESVSHLSAQNIARQWQQILAKK